MQLARVENVQRRYLSTSSLDGNAFVDRFLVKKKII